MFSNLSSSSISLATVTPSLVMRGAPNDLSSRTLRPLGPSATRTAWVSVSMPCNILSRASTENFTSLADISVFLFVRPHSGNDYWASPNDDGLSIRCFPGLRGARFTVSSRTRIWRAQSGGLPLGLDLDQHPHNVALFHDEVLDAIDFDLGARPFAEQDVVADLDVDRDELAALVAAAGSNGDDLALLRLLLGGVGNDDATSVLRLCIDSHDDNAVVKRSEFNWCSLTFQAVKLDITLQAVLWGVVREMLQPCFSLCFLGLILGHQHSELMFDGDRRRKFDFSSEPVIAHWTLL